jgi:hypothetical protein
VLAERTFDFKSSDYKDVNALLMKEGAQDFRSGQKFDRTVFFGENVDIHHIFPQDSCKHQGIKPDVYDSIIGYRRQSILGDYTRVILRAKPFLRAA